MHHFKTLADWAWIRDNSVHHVVSCDRTFWETEHPEKPSKKVRTNLCRDPVSLYFSNSLRGMLGHPRNARMVEMAQKARLLTNRRQWVQRAFESIWFSHQIIPLGGKTSCGFDQGAICQPREKSKSPRGDEEVLGEINVSENKSDHPTDVTVMLILDLAFKQSRWVYMSTTVKKTEDEGKGNQRAAAISAHKSIQRREKNNFSEVTSSSI